MKRVITAIFALLALLPLSIPHQPALAQTPPSKSAPKAQVKVWVNTKSGVYHYPGTRWYGKTKDGKFMPEADAIKAGYRAAKNNQ